MRKASLLIRNADQNRLLILVNPPRRCFFLGNILETPGLQLALIRFAKIPLNPIGCAVELTQDIEFNHLAQFIY